MMKVRSNWHGNEVGPLVRKRMRQRIQRCAGEFWSELQAALNARINPPPYKNSAPKGEPPAKRTGFLAASVTTEYDEPALKVRVGLLANAKYGLFLERKHHPWFMVTLKRMQSRLKAIMRGK